MTHRYDSSASGTLDKSVYENFFQLDNYCEQGEWKILLEAENQDSSIKQEYSFEVEEYVLPKFEVEIGLNKGFIVLGDKGDIPVKIDGHIQA